ncbi:hypothetical protein BGZ61DRAFT_497694 [Ilyonectria robusta]|uniref:uncharacterized protein n=1 Tax=Ilyonectria robusta TaxID=1079257 RepID=UPI001E8DE4D5|nr:uncharacterized protein BGZ61DRAFT_497694 [Ilyonectria robusta]KAH8670543.1 hypothetical protein BGZ61DRAFT_497694 [Ilyonectria robusta]
MQTAASLPASKPRRFKRERSGDPILISSRSPSPSPRSSKRSRDRVFTALEHGDPFLRTPRSIITADDLDEVELKRCFEILHACAEATDPTVTLTSTRETMEGFLDAIFKDWTGNEPDEPAKPAMDFVLREYIGVGNVCQQPGSHRGAKSCADAPLCRAVVYDGIDWLGLLKNETKRSCIAKIHKYNKHSAVWHARKLIRGWAKGSISMGEDNTVLSFVKREAVNAVFVTMGDGA